MKKSFLTHLTTGVLFSLIVLLGLSSCEKEPQDTAPSMDEWLADVKYNIIEHDYYSVEEMADLLYGLEGANPDNNDLRRRFIENSQLPNDDIDQGWAPGYHLFWYEYYSTDQLGNVVKLSAFMSAGEYWWFGAHYTDQDNIYLICPYTHTKEDECATKDNGGYEFMTFLSLDNLFIMPDGQGFGSNSGNVQPYVDHITQAKQIIDAMEAGFKIYMDKGGKMENNWKLRVIGASQGGGNAMAVHKFLDTRTKTVKSIWPWDRNLHTYYYRSIWNFDYSLVCCGPYSPEVTMQTYKTWRQMSYPCVIPLVIKSMLARHPELTTVKGYKEEDFFSGKWNENKADFDRIYRDKTMNSDDLNYYICNKLGLNVVREHNDPPMVPLDKMLSTDMLNPDSQIYKDFMECLKEQDLTSGWKPYTKTKIWYSDHDEVVPCANAEKLIRLFESNNVRCEKTERHEGHVSVCQDFILSSW